MHQNHVSETYQCIYWYFPRFRSSTPDSSRTGNMHRKSNSELVYQQCFCACCLAQLQTGIPCSKRGLTLTGCSLRPSRIRGPRPSIAESGLVVSSFRTSSGPGLSTDNADRVYVFATCVGREGLGASARVRLTRF